MTVFVCRSYSQSNAPSNLPLGTVCIGGDCKSSLKEFLRMKHEVAIPVSIAVLPLAFFMPKVSLVMAPKNPPAPVK